MTRLPDGSPEYLEIAETQVVGGVLVNADLDQVRPVLAALGPQDFRDHTLGVVWKAIENVARCDIEPTVPTVALELERMEWLDRIGGEPRLTQLAGEGFIWAGPNTLLANAGVVKDWSNRRAVIKQASETAAAAYRGEVKPRRRPVYEDENYQGMFAE